MLKRQKIGGIAAMIEAATFVIGFVMAATVLSDYTTGDPDPGESVAFVLDNQTALYTWYLIILIIFGVALVPLVLALHERLKADAPGLVQTATAFGIIWAGLVLAAGMTAIIGLDTIADLRDTDPTQVEPVWSALDSVQNGLGGGTEIVGGLWVLLISAVALQAGALPRALSCLGIVAGVAGLVTVIPGLESIGAVFGLGLIAWFVWVGISMLRSESSRPADTSNPSLSRGL